MTALRTLLRAQLRRDRWLLVWWSLGITLLYYSQAVSVDGLYTSQADFDRAAASMEGNAAFVAMAGPTRALNTIGGQVTWQATAFGAIMIGLMSMLLVGRHTRGEEESGRGELVRAAPVHQGLPGVAAAIHALLANVLVGGLVAAGLVAYPLAVADSVALGVGLALCGWVFTGVALVAAQVASTVRGMYGLTGAAIALAYVLRAVGDVSAPVLSWLSPIGWYQAMHAFSGVRWWPALLLVLASAAALGLSWFASTHRDYGAGLLPARPGSPRAGRGLRSGLGLAWRLQRGSVAGWSVGMLFVGLAYGGIGNDVGNLVGEGTTSREMFLQGGGSLVEGFYATALVTLALMTCGYAVSSVLRPRAEEEQGHAEALLSTGLSRRDWLLGHVAVTVAGTAAVLVAGALGQGLSYAGVTGDPGEAVRLSAPLLLYLPAVLVTSGLARLLYGVSPRALVLAWLLVVVAAVVMLFGEVFDLPQWFQDLSPFEHVPLVPLEDAAVLPLLGLTAVAAGLSLAGQLLFRRRDLA